MGLQEFMFRWVMWLPWAMKGDDIEPVYSKMRHSRVVEGRIDPLEVYIMPLEIRYRNIGI